MLVRQNKIDEVLTHDPKKIRSEVASRGGMLLNLSAKHKDCTLLQYFCSLELRLHQNTFAFVAEAAIESKNIDALTFLLKEEKQRGVISSKTPINIINNEAADFLELASLKNQSKMLALLFDGGHNVSLDQLKMLLKEPTTPKRILRLTAQQYLDCTPEDDWKNQDFLSLLIDFEGFNVFYFLNDQAFEALALNNIEFLTCSTSPALSIMKLLNKKRKNEKHSLRKINQYFLSILNEIPYLTCCNGRHDNLSSAIKAVRYADKHFYVSNRKTLTPAFCNAKQAKSYLNVFNKTPMEVLTELPNKSKPCILEVMENG